MPRMASSGRWSGPGEWLYNQCLPVPGEADAAVTPATGRNTRAPAGSTRPVCSACAGRYGGRAGDGRVQARGRQPSAGASFDAMSVSICS